MTLFLLSIAAGVLTVLSPCVLPVLPLLFARPGSGRLFGGLALGFGVVVLLAGAGGAWVAQAHGVGRALALGLMAAFGLALAWPALATQLMRPLQALGSRVDARASAKSADWLLGASTGLLWAPCAGPVLGLILTTAALQGGSLATALPLLGYAVGASAALTAVRVLAGRVGGRLPAALRASLPWASAARRLTGVMVLAAVTLVASGWDTRLAAAVPGSGLERLEQAWIDRLQPPPAPPIAQPAPAPMPVSTAAEAPTLPVLGVMPPLSGATGWLQSKPLSGADLRGKVVLVEFWTFGCVNCQRALPSVRGWASRYRDDGLVVVGVHSPEFAFERDTANVERALRRMGLDFPIAIDNDFAIWKAWSNQYWPTLYLVDAQGRVRWRHVGEGAYPETEQAIRRLLDEARRGIPAGS
jgi:cytochrome c biogenesis protein CcdA/thiol-disulfide isomerase/thioredoxin